MVVLIRCGCSGRHAENMQGLKNFLTQTIRALCLCTVMKNDLATGPGNFVCLEKINCIYVFQIHPK